jgi:hypothetical protein
MKKLIYLSMLLSVSCSKDDVLPVENPVVFQLPMVAPTNRNCLQITEPLEVCDWTLASDAIVVGEVVATRLVYSPSRQPDGSDSFADDCEGLVNPAFEMQIEVKDTLYGEVPETLTVSFSEAVAHQWLPSPRGNSNRELMWGFGETSERGIVAGDTIGFALRHDVETGIWTPFEFSLFTPDLKFQEAPRGSSGDNCFPTRPEIAEGTTLEDLRQTIGTCTGMTDMAMTMRRFTEFKDQAAGICLGTD